jgi:protein-L-isoaspartate O-methyltransferase
MDSFPADLARFVNRTAALRFKGRDLGFRLSHALFSSFDIDEGTRLLLKSLAQQVPLSGLESVLDIGCGVGVIGACVATQAEKARIVMQDRDALAVAFTRGNCRANGLENVSADCCLAFRGLGALVFDLVTSNLPAKAGAPVLESFLRNAAGSLSPRGIAAIVIVAPLAAFVRDTLRGLGCQIVHSEETRSYLVVHFRAGSAATQPLQAEQAQKREDLAPYIRTGARFASSGFSYSLRTAHSLPDFDVLGHSVELAFTVMAQSTLSGRVLAWNPGQGHLAVGLAARSGRKIQSLALASRDALQCAITELNLASGGVPSVSSHALCSEAELPNAFPSGSFDQIIAAPMIVPRVPWQADLAKAAGALLKTGGNLVVVSTSTEMHRFLDQHHGLRLRTSRKHLGHRAAVLSKP